ncbi:hypothetical protein AAGG74_16090 [Bacillus mexicanus]|uniref:hypothetical protein n=1 Tax=Bacillus mexicanus TaxID=2834415 RepID=UPI003D1B749F
MKKKINTVIQICEKVKTEGVIWKSEYHRTRHIERRIGHNHISSEDSLKEYENIILELLNGENNEVYLYYNYKDDYYVFGNPETSWIAIFSEEAIIDTAFKVEKEKYGKNYKEYLAEEFNYLYLGRLRDFYKKQGKDAL